MGETENMDDLLAFLPIFENEKVQFVLEWNPYPQYSDEVKAFNRLAGKPFWNDRNYLSSEASKKINDDVFIASATLDDIKTMLTLYLRSERFGDGNWAHFLESGRIVAILQRIKVIRDELES